MSFYDENGDEVVAFSQKEVDAQIKAASTDTNGKAKVAEDALAAKTKEYDDLSSKYEDKKTSYKELQDKVKSDEGKYKEVLERDTNAYNKAIEDKIAKVAGDDKEYAAEIKKQLEGGVGLETNDAAAIDKQIQKAQALTNIELSREVNSPADAGGGAPIYSNEKADFTKTPEGKNTLGMLEDMMRLPADEPTK